MSTFGQFCTRVASELSRTGLQQEIVDAANDAIAEGAATRFYFNEVKAQSFPTVALQEYYDDLGMTEIDAVYYFIGTTRYDVALVNNLDADLYAGSPPSGAQVWTYSREGTLLRLYPIPSGIVTIYVDGYGRLTPSPLEDPADTNNWLNQGERYVRALTKRNVFRDVLRDYSEAAVYDAVATDEYDRLVEETNRRIGTGRIRPTQF